jgi:soluble lytic murein transglycosylase-like protein
MLFARIVGTTLTLLALLPMAVKGQDRYLVTLHSGFSIEATSLHDRGAQVALGLGDGEILFPASEIASIDPLAPLAAASSAEVASAPTSAEVPSPAPVSVEELIRRASERYGIPEEFVRSVAQAESALRVDAVSPKGAQGVMQLMPDTARALGVNPRDPVENIEGGARLLRELLLRYQNEPDQVRRALAAYNAGQGAVRKYKGVPPYRETRQYVEKVLRRFRQSAPGTARAESAASLSGQHE